MELGCHNVQLFITDQITKHELFDLSSYLDISH